LTMKFRAAARRVEPAAVGLVWQRAQRARPLAAWWRTAALAYIPRKGSRMPEESLQQCDSKT
jgi:hypothetical protein